MPHLTGMFLGRLRGSVGTPGRCPLTDVTAMVVLPGTPATPPRPCPFPHLLDHLVCLEQERRGHGEAERLGSREVDDQLEFRGPLHWQVRRLRTFENLIDEG